MRVRISEPTLLSQLVESLTRGDCVTARLTDDTFEVLHPFADDERQARLELSFFLRAWESQHPDVRAELI